MNSIDKDGNFECEFCGDKYNDESDGSIEHDDMLMCWDCYESEYCYHCELCEDSFEKPDSPDKTFFIVSKSSESEAGIPYGLYRAKRFPFLSIPVVGDITIWESDIELVNKINIEAVKNRRKVGTEYVCEGCFDKYKDLTMDKLPYRVFMLNTALKYERRYIAASDIDSAKESLGCIYMNCIHYTNELVPVDMSEMHWYKYCSDAIRGLDRVFEFRRSGDYYSDYPHTAIRLSFAEVVFSMLVSYKERGEFAGRKVEFPCYLPDFLEFEEEAKDDL